MSETFLFLFEGGPYNGQTKLPVKGHKFAWPLDETILAIDHHGVRDKKGYYEKFWESQGEAKPGQARGAKYKWISYEDDQSEEPPSGAYL